jgi:hypothetical protein
MKERESAALARLRDLLMQGQESLEGMHRSRLEGLFARVRHVNVGGRFLEREELLARLRELEPKVDRPSLQLLRVEDLKLEEQRAAATYLVELSWVDVEAWAEVRTSALVTLELYRRALGWTLEGFTFTELPRGWAASAGPDWAEAMAGTGDAGMEFYSFTRYPT